MPLPSNATRKITERVAEVARRTAIQQSPIVEVTVVRRNPDGSLVVSDGRGGCLRQAPRANVRIGQKLKLGTEPSIGTQTNLPLITIDITSSTTPCPDDPRYPGGCEPGLIGVDCRPPAIRGAPLSAAMFSVVWTDPPTLIPYPGRNGVWTNRLSPSGDLRGGPADGSLFMDPNRLTAQQVVRLGTNYIAPHLPGFSPWADQTQIGAQRMFLEFNTAIIPPSEEIISITMRLGFTGNTPNRISTMHSDRVIIVPSDHNGIAETSNWDKVLPVVLAEVPINDIIDAGSQPPADYPATFTVDVPLDPVLAAPYINRSGSSKFAILMRLDTDPDSVLPAPGLFGVAGAGNRDVVPSGIPDDTVHVTPGSYQVGSNIYTDVSYHDIVLSQQDVNGRTLAIGESYLGVLIQPPGNDTPPVLVKGNKSLGVPRLPPYEIGGITLSWISVGCLHAITPTEITNDPPMRPFANLSNPNERRQSGDSVLFRDFAEVQLLVATGGNSDT